jgi:hypothetical protein
MMTHINVAKSMFRLRSGSVTFRGGVATETRLKRVR